MEGTPAPRIWRPWTIWLPCVLALLWSGLLVFAELVAGLVSDLNEPLRHGRPGSTPR